MLLLGYDTLLEYVGICEYSIVWWYFNIEGLTIHFVGEAECKEGLVCYAVAPGNLILLYDETNVENIYV